MLGGFTPVAFRSAAMVWVRLGLFPTAQLRPTLAGLVIPHGGLAGR